MTPSRSARSFATNTVYSGISEVSLVLLFLLVIISARLLGDAQFGVFSFALAFVNVFGFLMEGGLSFVYTRAVSRNHDLAEKYLGNVLSLQLLFCFVGMAMTLAAIVLVESDPQTLLIVALLAGAEALRFLKYLYRFVFRTVNRFDIEALSVMVERVLLLVVGMAVLFAGYGVTWVALAFLLVRIVDVVVALLLSTRLGMPPRLYFDFSLWPMFVRQAIPFIVIAAVVMLLFKIDSILLAFMASDAEVGWYNAAYRLLEGLYLFPKIITNLLYPAFARSHRDPEVITRLFGYAVRYVLLMAMPVMVVGVILSHDITLFIYGDQYVNAIIALQVLLLGTFFLCMHEIVFVLLTAIDRQRVMLLISLAALVLNVVANLLMIPVIGYVGAGIATVIAEGLIAILAMTYVAHLGYRVPYLRLLCKPLLAAVVGGGVAHVLPLHIVFTLPLAATAYFGILTLLGYWQPYELATAQKVLNRVLSRLPLRRATTPDV